MANFDTELKFVTSTEEEPNGIDIIPFEEIHEYLDDANIANLVEGERYLIHKFKIGKLDQTNPRKVPYIHDSYTVVEYVGKNEKGNLLVKELFSKRFEKGKGKTKEGEINNSFPGWYNIPRMFRILNKDGTFKSWNRIYSPIKKYDLKYFPGTEEYEIAYQESKKKDGFMLDERYTIKELGPMGKEITMENFDDESEERAARIMNEILESKIEYETEDEEEEERKPAPSAKISDEKPSEKVVEKEDSDSDEDQGLIFRDSSDEEDEKVKPSEKSGGKSKRRKSKKRKQNKKKTKRKTVKKRKPKTKRRKLK
uniref:Uncharacterized protein n=1 Tax=viral metagenome TaxID=1070528 RepID=A0A6C0D7V1_9ZZZZ